MRKQYLIEIIRYSDCFKEQWDLFAQQAKNSTFLIQRDYMEYHQDRWEDFSLLFFVNQELTAILPACILGDKVFSHKGLTYGGLIVKTDCKFDLYKKMFLELIFFLEHSAVQSLEIKTLPSIYCKASSDEIMFLNQFFETGIELNIGSVIYLNKPVSMSDSVVRNAKKALKNGIVIRKCDDFETFWVKVLIPRLHDRFDKKPVHSLEEILLLKKRFPKNIELIAAFLENEMIAGTVLFKNVSFTKSQYIGSKANYNKLGSLDLLHFEIIRNMESDYFDFGTSLQDNSLHENEGLLSWKEQFGARTLCFYTYTFKIS